MSTLVDLVNVVLKLRAEALEAGGDQETIERATVYTEKRIRELALLNVPAIKCVWAAFADGFMTGRGHCGQGAAR